MTPVRPASERRFRRAAHLASATAVCATSLILASPGLASAGPSLVAGNLLVSTSEYTDLPSITAGSTVAAHLRDNFQHLGRDVERERALHGDDHDWHQ